MNKLIIVSILLISQSFTYSQNISLSDLEEFIANPKSEEIHKQLISKKWFKDTKHESHNHIKVHTWYTRNENNEPKIINLYNFENTHQKIEYYTYDLTTYQLLFNQVEKKGYKFLETINVDDLDYNYYENNKFIIETTNLNDSNGYIAKVVLILKNGIYDDYDNLNVVFNEDRKSIRGIIEYHDEKEHGSYKLYNDNGNIQIVGSNKNGLEHGEFTSYNDDGSLAGQWTMKNGKRQGESVLYLKNRNIIEPYVDDILSGDYHIYDLNTNGDTIRHLTAIYKNNKFNGVAKLYNVSKGVETLIHKRHHVNDLRNGPYTTVLNDSIIYGNYKNDSLNGKNYIYRDYNKPITTIDTTGLGVKLIRQGVYKSGIKIGMWKYIYNDQNIIIETEYVNGEPSSELYKTLSKKELFNGVFKFSNTKSKEIEERKIKNGLRNGYTIFKDDNGKIIRKIKYKKGALKS